jgi:hypothetical protein
MSFTTFGYTAGSVEEAPGCRASALGGRWGNEDTPVRAPTGHYVMCDTNSRQLSTSAVQVDLRVRGVHELPALRAYGWRVYGPNADRASAFEDERGSLPGSAFVSGPGIPGSSAPATSALRGAKRCSRRGRQTLPSFPTSPSWEALGTWPIPWPCALPGPPFDRSRRRSQFPRYEGSEALTQMEPEAVPRWRNKDRVSRASDGVGGEAQILRLPRGGRLRVGYDQGHVR